MTWREEFVVRYCRCGHADFPVRRHVDMLKNKCPECNAVMVSGIRTVPHGKVITNGEEKLGEGSSDV